MTQEPKRFGRGVKHPPGWRHPATIKRQYRPETYGEQTRKSLGLEQGFEKSIKPEEGKAWENIKRRYAGYFYNYPGKTTTPSLRYWMRGAQLGLSPQQYERGLELKALGAELTPTEKYLFGVSDIAPSGYPSIPSGNRPEMMMGVPSGGKSPAAAWFEEQYPSIRGGARPQMSNWALRLSGRFAPRIKTIEF